MKKVLVVLAVVALGLTSCRTSSCPSHSKTWFYHNRM